LIRFYLDEDLSPTIAIRARAYVLDVWYSLACGNNGQPDEFQLAYAAAQGRVLVSRNYADFERLAKYYAQEGLSHAGILLIARSLDPRDFAGVVRALEAHAALYPDGMPDTLMYLHRVP
jgi:hypothetical protein